MYSKLILIKTIHAYKNSTLQFYLFCKNMWQKRFMLSYKPPLIDWLFTNKAPNKGFYSVTSNAVWARLFTPEPHYIHRSIPTLVSTATMHFLSHDIFPVPAYNWMMLSPSFWKHQKQWQFPFKLMRERALAPELLSRSTCLSCLQVFWAKARSAFFFFLLTVLAACETTHPPHDSTVRVSGVIASPCQQPSPDNQRVLGCVRGDWSSIEPGMIPPLTVCISSAGWKTSPPPSAPHTHTFTFSQKHMNAMPGSWPDTNKST